MSAWKCGVMVVLYLAKLAKLAKILDARRRDWHISELEPFWGGHEESPFSFGIERILPVFIRALLMRLKTSGENARPSRCIQAPTHRGDAV